MMLKARPDRKNPLSSSGAKPAGMIGSRSADRIRAAAIGAANAVHMSAPAEKHHACRKPLQLGSHPHMRSRPLITLNLILSLSKDEAKISCLFSRHLELGIGSQVAQ